MEHTPTPWYCDGDGVYSNEDCEGAPLAHVLSMGYDNDFRNIDARRIVACVNACAGIPQDDVEELAEFGVMELTVYADDMRQQRDALQQQLATERASLFAENQRKQQLEQQVEELVQALEFYADKQRYMGSNQRVEAPDIYGESPSNTVYLWDVMKDGGDIARAVIQKVRGGE